jgi:hypothetical protein
LTQHFLASLFAAAIGAVVVVTILGLDKQRWISLARKLGARSDIALPGPLADRVARFLRNESLFGQLVTALATPLLVAIIAGGDAHRNWAAWFPWILAGLPLCWALFCFVLSLWPRWTASGGYRVAHLGSLPVRQAFTPAEFTAVGIGAVLTAALGAWGLRYVAAPATWWLACAAALAAAFAAWRYAAASLMSRPSSASDTIELGWDDLLRFRQVRAVTVYTAWAPAIFVYLTDCMMSSAFVQQTTAPGMVSYQVQGWPILVPIAVGLLLAWVFRQGRHLWRRAWLERDGVG